MNILVIDAGNSSTTVARYHGNRCISDKTAILGGIAANPTACLDAVKKVMTSDADVPYLAMLASVTPKVNDAWASLVKDATGLQLSIVNHCMKMPFAIGYPHPETTGADRLANVAAATVIYGNPSLIIDIGTAVTYDVVSALNIFFTGVIGPGPDILARSLHDYTALLPLVEWWKKTPPRVPSDTESAMLYGIDAGFCGIIRETVTRLLPLAGPSAKLIATGGFAKRFTYPLGMNFIIDQELTLKGIGILAEQKEVCNE